MNPFEGENRPTWQDLSSELPRPSGVGPEAKSFEEWLGQIQYGGSLPASPSRSSRLVPLVLLLVGLGVGGAVGWYWGMQERPQPQTPETKLEVPRDEAVAPEGILTGKDDWLLVWKGEVLRLDEPVTPSVLAEMTPPPAPPAPRERQRARGAGETMTKGYLGVRGKTFQRAGIEGVKILEVFPDSPAAKAGLRAELDPQHEGAGETAQAGHIIVAANGQRMRSEEDLARFMDRSTPGDVMQVLVTAPDGTSQEAFIVVLDEPPQHSR